MDTLTDFSPLAMYLGQPDVWVHSSGEHRLVVNLEPEHRLNCARWLAKRADRLLQAVESGATLATLKAGLPGDPDQVIAEWQKAWVRELPLYRALITGLPPGTSARARHWSGCPVRTAGAPERACLCHRVGCPHLRDKAHQCTCAHLVGRRKVTTHG